MTIDIQGVKSYCKGHESNEISFYRSGEYLYERNAPLNDTTLNILPSISTAYQISEIVINASHSSLKRL